MPLYRVKHTLQLERKYVPGEFLPEGVPARVAQKLVNIGWVEVYHTAEDVDADVKIAARLSAETQRLIRAAEEEQDRAEAKLQPKRKPRKRTPVRLQIPPAAEPPVKVEVQA